MWSLPIAWQRLPLPESNYSRLSTISSKFWFRIFGTLTKCYTSFRAYSFKHKAKKLMFCGLHPPFLCKTGTSSSNTSYLASTFILHPPVLLAYIYWDILRNCLRRMSPLLKIRPCDLLNNKLKSERKATSKIFITFT